MILKIFSTVFLSCLLHLYATFPSWAVESETKPEQSFFTLEVIEPVVQTLIQAIYFNNSTVTDALHKLSNVADVEIAIDGETGEELISKSYINVTIDEILLDIFQRKNIIALFRYNDQELVSINLWSFPQAEGSINIIKRQVGNNHNNGKVRPAAVSYSRGEMVESANGPQVITNSKIRNNKKSQGDKNKTYIPYTSLSKEKQSSSITEAPEDSTDSNSDIEENKDNIDLPTDDIPTVPEPVQVGGLESPPMPPIMSLYNN